MAELEKRLDDLTSQLNAAQSNGLAPFPLRTARKHYNFNHIFPRDLPHSSDAAEDVGDANTAGESPPIERSNPSISSSSTAASPGHRQEQPDAKPWESLWPLPNEADVLMQEYRDHLASIFPFVIVPAGLSAAEARIHRPFLWKAIMMTACHMDGARQIALGDELLREVAQAAYGRSNSCLDLLQGLELLMAW